MNVKPKLWCWELNFEEIRSDSKNLLFHIISYNLRQRLQFCIQNVHLEWNIN